MKFQSGNGDIFTIPGAISSLRDLFRGGGIGIDTLEREPKSGESVQDMPALARTLVQADGDIVTYFTMEKSRDPDFVQAHYEKVNDHVSRLNRLISFLRFFPLYLYICSIAIHALWPLFHGNSKEIWLLLASRLKVYGLFYIIGYLLSLLIRPLILRIILHSFKMHFPTSSLPERSENPMQLF